MPHYPPLEGYKGNTGGFDQKFLPEGGEFDTVTGNVCKLLTSREQTLSALCMQDSVQCLVCSFVVLIFVPCWRTAMSDQGRVLQLLLFGAKSPPRSRGQ